MGFFTKADPLQKLRADVEAKPKDSKLLLELAGQLKAKGAVGESAEYYLRAATALTELGFATKAVALLRQVTQMTPKSIPAHEALAACLEEMKVKEDLRTVLKALAGLYRAEGRSQDAQTAHLKIEALGPGR
jgi:thioredoxin-like negative regulator of GroEL